MQTFIAKKYRCPLVKTIVVITRHCYRFLGGIGETSLREQVDYTCSLYGECPRSTELSCYVRKLSEE